MYHSFFPFEMYQSFLPLAVNSLKIFIVSEMNYFNLCLKYADVSSYKHSGSFVYDEIFNLDNRELNRRMSFYDIHKLIMVIMKNKLHV